MRVSHRIATTAAVTVVLVGVQLQIGAEQDRIPQESLPTFRASTRLVPLDVRVIDRGGKPVTGLTASDFTVIENRVPQRIEHFAVQALTASATPPIGPLVRRRTAAATTIEPQDHRVFLIYLGRGDLRGPSDGVDGIIHLVKNRLLPQDRVAVMAWNRATEFTTDRTETLALLERFKAAFRRIEQALVLHEASLASRYGPRGVPAFLQSDIDRVFGGPTKQPVRTMHAQLMGARAAEARLRDQFDAFDAPESDAFARIRRELVGVDFDTYLRDVAQTTQDSGNLFAGIEYVRHVEGEKHLIWLTEFGLRRTFSPADPVEIDVDLARRAADARVVLNVIRAGGTETGRGPGAAASRQPPLVTGVAAMTLLLPASVSRTFAELTGGRSDANRFPSASVAADRIEEASRHQYLLGYYPTNAALDGGFRTVQVTVNRPGHQVLVRSGYYAREDAGPLGIQSVTTYSRIAAAAGDGREIPDLGVQGLARQPAGAHTLTLALTLDVSRVHFERDRGRNAARVELAVFALDRRQRTVGDVRRTIELSYADDRLAEVTTTGAPVTLDIPVTDAVTSVKVVAYDYASDRLGSRNLFVQK